MPALLKFLPLLLVPVAFLPDLGAALPLFAYYFRDVAFLFIPSREFQATELMQGRLPFWNPYLHEGEFFVPSFYPPDLLHVLSPTPEFISWLLSLHLPLAALAAYALMRSRGMSQTAAFAAGSIYALGGFALSTLNLYFFLQVLALAPLLLLTLDRAARDGGRWIAACALVTACMLCTLGVELVGQALVLGIVLALWSDSSAPPGRTRRLAAGVAIGIGLAAVPMAVMVAIIPETTRAAGLDLGDAGQLALPSFTLLQLVVPRLLGEPGDAQFWWGDRFFVGSFPYFVSIYFGALVLALAALGAATAARRERIVLLAAAVLGLWYSLGPAGYFWQFVQLIPGMEVLRVPSKAMFVTHIAIAWLAGRGLDRLRSGDGWHGFGLACAVLGAGLAAISAGAVIGNEAVTSWLGLSESRAKHFVELFPRDTALAALAVLSAPVLALVVRTRRLPPAAAAAVLAGIIVIDLVRADIGINRQVTPLFYRPLPGMAAQQLGQPGGGRVFILSPDLSPSYRGWYSTGPREAQTWAYFASRQMLETHSNMLDRVESAGSADKTRFAPQYTELPAWAHDPRNIGQVLPQLRQASVTRILSLDRLEDPELRLRAAVPLAVTGLAAHVYELGDSWSRAALACRTWSAATRRDAVDVPYRKDFDPRRDVTLEEATSSPVARPAGCNVGQATMTSTHAGEERYAVESDGPGWLVARGTYARGWRATVDGAAAEVRRADGRHRAVAVPAGRHEVVLRYEPPGLQTGLLLTVLALAALLWVVLRPWLGRKA